MSNFSTDLMSAFQRYSWPGNIRQLKNEVEKMRVLHSEKLAYTLADFPFQTKDKTPITNNNSETEKPYMSPIKNSGFAVGDVLSNSKSSIRRLDRIKDLFVEHKKFTRKEIIEITKFAPKTIASDLEKLCKDGVIERVKPNATARTHYFILK